MNTILVTGGKGQLGTELQRLPWPAGWRAHAIDVEELDLADGGAVERFVREGDYAAVINGAAYTAVDRAETETTTAWAVNALAPAALARGCAAKKIPLVQVSTDYVFDGSGNTRRRPDAKVGPLNAYGASKLGGELAVTGSRCRHVIVRTSWVVSAHGSNFIRTMLRLAVERDALSVVDDQVGAPTSAADLAAALATIALRSAAGTVPNGVHHFTNAGETSWCAFAREIFRQSAMRGGPSCEVSPISTSEYPTPARRPLNSRLDLGSLLAAFGVSPRPWEDALSDILDELIGPAR